MNAPSVDVVVVSYNVRELLCACVRSLRTARMSGEVRTIVVVDCHSNDGSGDAIRAEFPNVTVLDTPNTGYGAAVNFGATQTHSQYVLALNPDTVVSIGAVGAMAAYLDEHPWIGIVGPRLVFPDGSDQLSRRCFPARLTPLFESTIFHRHWPNNRWARAYHMADETTSRREEVDWIVGACMLIRRAAFEQCGGFDVSFFLYSEEVELCWRFRHHGWRVAWLPEAVVVHHESASAGQDVSQRQLRFDRSRIQLARRMYGSTTGQVVRVGLLGGYLLQLATESAKWSLGNRRTLRRDRMQLYAGLLRSGLRDSDRR